MQQGVQKQTVGMFHTQLAHRYDTTKLFTKILDWIAKEDIPLWKWNSMKGDIADKLVILHLRLSEQS